MCVAASVERKRIEERTIFVAMFVAVYFTACVVACVAES